MVQILYIIIILIATFLGATAGIGGGVIIKPLFDTLGFHSIEIINFYAGSAVFTMALYATSKHIQSKTRINFRIVLLTAIGSLLGGILGTYLLKHTLSLYDTKVIEAIQSFSLAMLMLFVIGNTIFKYKSFIIKNTILILVLGVILGFISSFLGIGGGPINVAVFILFFSCDIKQATVYSLATIVFAQASNLVTLALTSDLTTFEPINLLYILPSAFIGGIIGTYTNKRLKDKQIQIIFNLVVLFVLCINIYNFINVIF